MERWAKKVFTLTVAIFVVALVAGCEEEQMLPDVRKCRLIANENRHLQEQLEQREKEIERQKGLVDKCRQEKKHSEQQTQENIKDLVDDAVKNFEENVKLRQENDELKARIKELEAKLKGPAGQG